MWRLLVLLFFSYSLVAVSADSGRPVGQNCSLAQPPADAGEEMNHGITLKIYPRARNIGSNYTGCQAMWYPDGDKWGVVAIVAIEHGDPVRIWSPDGGDPARFACHYKQGRVIRGDAKHCAAPEFLIAKSLAPGCVERIKAAGQFPAGCKYE
jgi:hypothetical protein